MRAFPVKRPDLLVIGWHGLIDLLGGFVIDASRPWSVGGVGSRCVVGLERFEVGRLLIDGLVAITS